MTDILFQNHIESERGHFQREEAPAGVWEKENYPSCQVFMSTVSNLQVLSHLPYHSYQMLSFGTYTVYSFVLCCESQQKAVIEHFLTQNQAIRPVRVGRSPYIRQDFDHQK